MGVDPRKLRWPESRVERLVELVEEGCTAQQVADELKISRNAVISKANRIGCSFQHGFKAGPIPVEKCPVVPKVAKPSPPPVCVRPDPEHPNRCVTSGCRGAKQHNRYSLCASCNWKRLKSAPRENNTFQVTPCLAGNYG